MLESLDNHEESCFTHPGGNFVVCECFMYVYTGLVSWLGDCFCELTATASDTVDKDGDSKCLTHA